MNEQARLSITRHLSQKTADIFFGEYDELEAQHEEFVMETVRSMADAVYNIVRERFTKKMKALDKASESDYVTANVDFWYSTKVRGLGYVLLDNKKIVEFILPRFNLSSAKAAFYVRKIKR